MLMRPLTTLDATFPTLAEALDPAIAGTIVRAALERAGYPVSSLDLEIERVRLKPGKKALFGYRLCGKTADGERFDQRAMLTLWPDAREDRLPVVEGGDTATPQFGPPVLKCDRLAATAWFFPNDRKVSGIARLLDQATQFGDKVTVVHYVPEQGCTVRVDTRHASVFGKVRVDDRCAVAARVGSEATRSAGENLRLAPVLVDEPEDRSMWQRGVAGRPVTVKSLLSQPRCWTARIARAIAQFHAIAAPKALAHRTPSDLSSTLDRRVARITESFPFLSERLSKLAGALSASEPQGAQLVLSHCDLHLANLLWDGESFALIDLDTCALAPRGLDHASLAAACVQRLLADGVEKSCACELIEAFEEAADAAEAPWPTHFSWYLAWCLVAERLYRCATRLKAPDECLPDQLLKIAEWSLVNQAHADA